MRRRHAWRRDGIIARRRAAELRQAALRQRGGQRDRHRRGDGRGHVHDLDADAGPEPLRVRYHQRALHQALAQHDESNPLYRQGLRRHLPAPARHSRSPRPPPRAKPARRARKTRSTAPAAPGTTAATTTCHKPEGHGWANLRSGMAQSCDRYFMRLPAAPASRKSPRWRRSSAFGHIYQSASPAGAGRSPN